MFSINRDSILASASQAARDDLAKAHRAICSKPIKAAPRKQRGIPLDACDGSHYEREEQDRIERLNAETETTR
jgi:hypothetical protein